MTKSNRMATPVVCQLLLAALISGTAASLTAQEERELDRFLEQCGEHGRVEQREHAGEESRLSDQCIPLAQIPNRPRPLSRWTPSAC